MSDLPIETGLCPSCLTVLPTDYPFDHVAIDRAAAGDKALFKTMSDAERREVITLVLSRGQKLLDLAETFNWPFFRLQELLPSEHPDSLASDRARTEQVIRELWGRGLRDVTIAARTGLDPSKVGRTRKRLGLATLPRAKWIGMTASAPVHSGFALAHAAGFRAGEAG